jgi:hypothetical protein
VILSKALVLLSAQLVILSVAKDLCTLLGAGKIHRFFASLRRTTIFE